MAIRLTYYGSYFRDKVTDVKVQEQIKRWLVAQKIMNYYLIGDILWLLLIC